ncbi:MAG: PCRF domain-containing protein, partial [Pseudomonadales bacterium]|nr:PCRF domain-containing protein [Pseudomonadales bacterium]NIX09739.1 PCRF domain-containing protein [Pseudomonadales bacterium]
VTQLLADPEVTADLERYRKLSKEHNDLTPIVSTYDRYCKVSQELEDQRGLLADPD